MDGVDGGLAEPALAAYFTGHGGPMCGHGVGELFTQIKIAADAFVIVTIETEHGPGVGEVDRVFDLTVPADTAGVEVSKIHGQGLQLRKLVSEAGGVLDTLAFLLTVFGAGADFVGTHNHKSQFLPAEFDNTVSAEVSAVCNNVLFEGICLWLPANLPAKYAVLVLQLAECIGNIVESGAVRPARFSRAFRRRADMEPTRILCRAPTLTWLSIRHYALRLNETGEASSHTVAISQYKSGNPP